jgi:hypothetical protein
MNCISGLLMLTCLFGCVACGVPASETDTDEAPLNYAVHYTIRPDPGDGTVAVEMAVEQGHGQLRELSFGLTNSNAFDFTADGELRINEDGVQWLPKASGGSLHWRTRVGHQRDGSGFDAWLDENWGIFRAEDIIPRARTRTRKGANSETSMSFQLPGDWSSVTEYSTLDSRIEIRNPARRFDQPSGWIAIGNLGIRRETIAGTRIAVAAPEGESVRRMDMLALLNWTLPEMASVLPNSIARLTIVSAGDPMWRGGLSAPGSIFIHADRPLISENATSTLVHELVHVAMDISADSGSDWIVEGLAEYYSLELLQRGGAITARRYRRALERQAEWSGDASQLCTEQSSGATTALAVITLRKLDNEIRNTSAGEKSLDNVVAALANSRSRVTVQSLTAIVDNLLEKPADTLQLPNLPGCEEYQPVPEA